MSAVRGRPSAVSGQQSKNLPRIVMPLAGADGGVAGFFRSGCQQAFLEKEEDEYANRDGGVGDVENGTKKLKAFPAY